MKKRKKFIFISWAPYCSRSDNIAREFGGKSYMIYYSFLGSNYYTIIVKYLFQTIQTLLILLKERPDVVFVMSPSVFASGPVYLYCKLFDAVYIIDAHTGALRNPMWKKVEFLQIFFCRNALMTIVTNETLLGILKKWGAVGFIMPDVPIKCSNPELPSLKGKINITLVNSFAVDEPLSEFIEAANSQKQINFYITGKINSSSKQYIEKAEKNVIFTDFLPESEYYGLLLQSDIIIALTKGDNTMQRGAYEGIYLGKPVITSDWPILQRNFSGAAIFVDNTAESILKGIQKMVEKYQIFRKGALTLRDKKKKRWETMKKNIYSNIYSIKN